MAITFVSFTTLIKVPRQSPAHRCRIPHFGGTLLRGVRLKDVDGRVIRAFTPVFDGLCPAMTVDAQHSTHRHMTLLAVVQQRAVARDQCCAELTRGCGDDAVERIARCFLLC
jgi:hypothetical protein